MPIQYLLLITYLLDLSAKYPLCATALQFNEGIEDYYNIQHGDMMDSIKVHCKVTDGVAYAILHHESEKAEMVQGYESAGSFT